MGRLTIPNTKHGMMGLARKNATLFLVSNLQLHVMIL